MTVLNELAAPTAVPDYGWSSTEPEDSHDYLQPVVLRVLDTLSSARADHSKPLRIFDAGCGNGALLRRMSQLGFSVAGCDASESGVLQARKSCADHVRVERFSVYDDLAAAFTANWDVVVAMEVIEHLYSPRDFIRQIDRLLVPGGSIVLTTPYHGYLKNLALAATGAMENHFTALWDGGHIKFWSQKTLRSLLQEFGFAQTAFHGAGRLPLLWKSMVMVASKPSSAP